MKKFYVYIWIIVILLLCAVSILFQLYISPPLSGDPDVCTLVDSLPGSDEKQVANFFLQNNTGQNILIDRVVSGCGCLVVQNPPNNVAPHERAALIAEINTHGMLGEYSKKIDVHYKYKESNHTLALTINGYAKATAAMYAMPSVLNLGEINRNQSNSALIDKSLIIGRYDQTDVSNIKVVSAPTSVLNVECKDTPVTDEHKRTHVRLVFRFLNGNIKKINVGRHMDELIFVTDHVHYPQLSVRVMYDVVD